MSKQRRVMVAVVAIALILWSVLARETYPLVFLAAGGLVMILVSLGPSNSRPDPRDAQDAAEDIARRPRHTHGPGAF